MPSSTASEEDSNTTVVNPALNPSLRMAEPKADRQTRSPHVPTVEAIGLGEMERVEGAVGIVERVGKLWRTKVSKFLIYADYGFDGVLTTGQRVSIHFGGTGLWQLNGATSPESEMEAMIDAQNNSSYKRDFDEYARKNGIDPSIGRWIVFSVIKEYPTNDNT